MEPFELPVEWFDSPEPDAVFSNNDLDPTEPDPSEDYQGPSMWHEWHPHPDMEGVTCSAGYTHEPRRWRRPPVPPIGLADYPVPRPLELGR